MIKERLNGKTFCIIFSVILFTFLFLQLSRATDMQVTKSSVSQIKIGDILEVTISINNLESSAINVTVKETITDADPIDPPTFNIVKCPPDIKFCVEPPYYSWNVTLNPNSVYNITYKIKPLTLGNSTIPATKVTTDSGEIFYSDSLQISVMCNSDGICEPNLGENYLNCPQDCSTTTTTIATTTTIPIKSSPTPIYVYIIFIAIIIVAAAFLLFRVKIER